MVLRSSIHLSGWILAASVALATGCSSTAASTQAPSEPELRLEAARFRLFRGDLLRADGTAAELTFQRGTTELRAHDLSVTLFEGSQRVLVSAPEGSGLASARSFQADGGVRAVRGGDVATTDTARYDPSLGERGRVVGDRPVELAGRGYRLRGAGFTLDPATGQIAVRGGARLDAGLAEVRR